jgi:hypothetical protein
MTALGLRLSSVTARHRGSLIFDFLQVNEKRLSCFFLAISLEIFR